MFLGEIHIGGQEHFYLETNCTLAVPQEDGEMELFVSTQAASKTQVIKYTSTSQRRPEYVINRAHVYLQDEFISGDNVKIDPNGARCI